MLPKTRRNVRLTRDELSSFTFTIPFAIVSALHLYLKDDPYTCRFKPKLSNRTVSRSTNSLKICYKPVITDEQHSKRALESFSR